MSFSGLVDW